MNTSKEYSIFKLLKENREINEKNVSKIVDSIKEWGLIPGRPILVDSELNIIDGQHRFMALKKLNMPIEYVVIEGDVVFKTMALNSTQQSWKIIDYVKSYSEQNIDCYRKLIKFNEKYKLGTSNSINILMQNRLTPSQIRKGVKFEINEDADRIADFILSLENISFNTMDKFVQSIVILFKKADQKQINLIKTNYLKIPKSTTVTDYVSVFENIINYKKRGNTVIKL